MPKVFYTERDVEDLVKRGVHLLEINDNTALTDLAYEKANRLGVKLVRDKPENPPGAPVRPYISQPVAPAQGASAASQPATPSSPRAEEGELHQRVRAAVVAQLGNQVDAKLLDVIIQRVLKSTGVK